MSQTTLHCGTCRAELTLPAGERAQVCPYCASPNVAVTARSAHEEPLLCIPHAEGERRARAALATWQRKLGFFRHPGVRRAKLEAFRGVYLPAVLYSAVARASYSASIGEEYYVTETYTVTVNGKTQTRTRRVKKHEWVPLSGRADGWAADILVSASRGVANDALERIEPYDYGQLRRFSTGLVAGWGVETPSRSTAECLDSARAELVRHLEGRLAAFMPGDTHSDLRFSTQTEQETATPVLVPVWVLALAFASDKPALQVLINGQTGKVAAKVPWSWPRILGAVLLVAAAVAAAVFFLRGAP